MPAPTPKALDPATKKDGTRLRAQVFGESRYRQVVMEPSARSNNDNVHQSPCTVNVLYPPDLINQLRIFAVLAQFRLQYYRGIDTQIIGQTQPPYNAASGA